MELENGSIGRYQGTNIVRFPCGEKKYRHLVCEYGSLAFSVNLLPVERKRHTPSGRRLQVVCDQCGHRATIGYGPFELSAEN